MPIGGQAVIEGVLMKGKELWGLAVRRPDGTIFRESWNNDFRVTCYPWKTRSGRRTRSPRRWRRRTPRG